MDTLSRFLRSPGSGMRTMFSIKTVLISALLLFFHGSNAIVAQSRQDLLDEYDFIVVGGGTAGLTVADRLSENGDYTVLVIEYGYLDSSESILAVTTPDVAEAGPDQYPDATRYYNTTTVPQTELDGQRKLIRAGAVVGGSSAVNGLLFDRGSAEDYDAWVEFAGESGEDYASEWGWENFLPWFKKSATFHPPDQGNDFGITYDAEAAYGGSTPIHASYRPYQWPTQQLMFNALKSIPGIDSPPEAADGSKHGVLWAPNTMDATNHTRSYAKLGHYDNGPITRSNFYLLPAHRVVRVHLGFSDDSESWTAEGVSFTPRDGDGEVASVKARREVIVSAGTMHTPQLLERSGIGPEAILEAAGVPVKVNLPGVGYNFQSHTSITVGFQFTRDVFPTEADLRTNRTFRLEAERQWDSSKTGPYSALVNSGVFLPFPVFSNNTDAIISKLEDQSPEQYLPEGLDSTLIRGYAVQKQILIRQLQSTKSAWLESLFFGQSSLGAILLHIFSRGSVHISPADDGIRTDPVIDYRAFTNPVDLDLNVELLKGVRWFMGHDAMVEALGPVETSPRLTDDESIRSWIRRTVNANVAHQVGTSALGPLELGGVVGPDLRVHGVLGLSIADNSIMPLVIGSHTSSTAYAIGEKAADLIKRRHGFA